MSEGGSRWRVFSGKQQQPGVPRPKKKRVSRHEQDLKRQRQVRIGMAIVGVLLLAVLVGGALNEYILKPRATLATVNGVEIKRSDYWKARASDLNAQAGQYQQFAQFVGPEQAEEYEQLARESLARIPAVWGSTETDPGTLNRMIEDQLYLQGAEKMGLAVTPEEADLWNLNRFAPFDAPLLTPEPTPTFTAARAAMFTATAGADLAALQAAEGTPSGTPEAGDATPVSSVATPVGDEAQGTPVADPTEPPSATPVPADARATAEAGLATFEDAFFPAARMSREDYRRLVVIPALARDKVQSALADGVGQSAPMVEASHILVATKDLADKLEADLAGGANFAELASTSSTDTGTAANGGDLGWFTRDEMVKPFADAAFAMKPGETSAPVESEFGWHIIRVTAADPERPLTDQQITRIEQSRGSAWLEEQRAAAKITSVAPAAPDAGRGSFVPPPNAPAAPPMAPEIAVPQATPVE